MILNSCNPFTRNGARKIAGLRKMRESVANIEPELNLMSERSLRRIMNGNGTEGMELRGAQEIDFHG